MTESGAFRERLHQSYREWKAWDRIQESELDHASVADARRLGLAAGARVLDFGFGSGQFLDWARRNGYRAVGIENIEALVASATARGHEAYLGQLPGDQDSHRATFDAIVAFDVLEHLTREEIAGVLALFAELLRPDGKLLARFPNGHSPFGRLYQYGDATHCSVLSGEILKQLGQVHGFHLLGQWNAARSLQGRRAKHLRRVLYLMRDLVELALGHLYFNGRIPLDPNLVCIFQKDDKRGA